MLEHIPALISKDDNTGMTRLPEKDEVKRIIFELSGTNVTGLDGFSGCFF